MNKKNLFTTYNSLDYILQGKNIIKLLGLHEVDLFEHMEI